MKRFFLNVLVFSFFCCRPSSLTAAKSFTEEEVMVAGILVSLGAQDFRGVVSAPLPTLASISKVPGLILKSNESIFNGHVYTEAECSLCGQLKNLTFSSWKNHQKREMEAIKKGLQCSHCKMIFCGDKQLTIHVREVHQRGYSFRCGNCHREFSSSSAVSCHLRTVCRLGDSCKEFKCGSCNEWYVYTEQGEAEHKCTGPQL